MKIFHFREKCIGCNACVERAPEYWEIDPQDAKARLKGSIESKGMAYRKIDQSGEEQNRNAAKDCPVHIIKIQD